METNLYLSVINAEEQHKKLFEESIHNDLFHVEYLAIDGTTGLLAHLDGNPPDILLIRSDELNTWKVLLEAMADRAISIPVVIFESGAAAPRTDVHEMPQVWYSVSLDQPDTFQAVLRKFLELKQFGFHRSNDPLSTRIRENYYQLIAENATEGLLIIQDGKFVYMDPQIRNFLGYNDQALKSNHFMDFIHPHDQALVKEMHQKRLMGSERLEKYKFRVVSNSGDTVWMESDGVNIEWEGATATLNFIREITGQVEKETQLNTILEYFPVPLLQEDLSFVKNVFEGLRKKGVTSISQYFTEHPDEFQHCCQQIKIKYCNQRSLQFFEVEHLHHLESLYTEPQNKELQASRIRMLDAYWNNQMVFEEETIFKTQHGQNKNATLRSVLLPGKEKTWDTVLVSIIDLYERRQTDKQIRVLSQAIASSPVSVIITDIKGDIEYVNPKFTHVSGYTLEEMAGKKPSLLKSGKTSQAVYDDLWNTISGGDDWVGEIQNKKKSGELFWERVLISPVVNEEDVITHFIALKEDISERKQTETELINAKLKAEEADRLKTAFLANMSHEIRTPMNAIVGFSEILRTSDVSGPEKEEYFNIINNSCNTLSNLIDDIIDLAKIEAGQTKIAEDICKPYQVMKELQVYFEEEANKSGKPVKVILEAEIDTELIIKADEFRLRQILSNLLGNAIKFTHKGFIHWGCAVQKHNFLRFYVKDTGIGIPIENLEVIFDRFRQMDGSSVRKYGGTGLGLTVSKSLVELMGGKIWAESQEGRGSEFFFTLPYKVVSVEMEKQKPGTTDRKDEFIWKNKTILVVEDNLSNFEFIKAVLSKTKAKILWAESGLKAIDIFRKKNVDIVLMDIQIPEMDGYEATLRMKKMKPEIPVIAQTAYAMSHDREKALEVGCDDYISKPIKPLDLLNLMARFL